MEKLLKRGHTVLFAARPRSSTFLRGFSVVGKPSERRDFDIFVSYLYSHICVGVYRQYCGELFATEDAFIINFGNNYSCRCLKELYCVFSN